MRAARIPLSHDIRLSHRAMNRIQFVALVGLVALAVSAAVLSFKGSRVRENSAKQPPAQAFAEPAAQPSVIANMPSIEVPLALPAGAAEISHDAEVLGVCVDQQCRAYLLEAFDKIPARHLVNDLIDDVPVSVSYCPLSDCARVLTSDERGRPIELRVGGLGSNSLVLLFGNHWYAQDAPDLPLHDLPFVRTTWSEWIEDHPESDIYIGPGAAAVIRHADPS